MYFLALPHDVRNVEMSAALTVLLEADAKKLQLNLQWRHYAFWHVSTCDGCSSNENNLITCLLGNDLSLNKRHLHRFCSTCLNGQQEM